GRCEEGCQNQRTGEAVGGGEEGGQDASAEGCGLNIDAFLASSPFRRRPLPSGESLHVLPKWPNVRHPSESWDPATYKAPKALDPSFRWDDGEVLASSATEGGHQPANAASTIPCASRRISRRCSSLRKLSP